MFAHILEKVCVDTIESGFMTKDLAICIKGLKKYVYFCLCMCVRLCPIVYLHGRVCVAAAAAAAAAAVVAVASSAVAAADATAAAVAADATAAALLFFRLL